MLPFGAPGDIPPCIRHRPFGIAADRQRLPLLVRARSRCASATVGGLELFGRPSPIIRLRPGSKECEVSKFCAALLPQLMFVCLLARLRAEPKHPLPMHNQTKLTVAVIAVSHNRSPGFLNERNAIRNLLFPVRRRAFCRSGRSAHSTGLPRPVIFPHVAVENR